MVSDNEVKTHLQGQKHLGLRPRGNVRKGVNEKGRCNLRFAKRNSGAINARTEGDPACEEEEHRVGRGVKPDEGDAGKLRAAEHAAVPAADVGRRGGWHARAAPWVAR